MIEVRTRDFIHTKDDLYFASTNYLHPNNRIISFLRYIPNPNGDREKNGKKYSKVNSKEAFDYLKENHPDYLYFSEVANVPMMGVPIDKVDKIIRPEDRLKEIREGKDKKVTKETREKLIDLSDFFHYIAGIDYENLGISGSTCPGLQKAESSDLDFVVYGLENHRKAVNTFKKYHDQEVEVGEGESKRKIVLNPIQNEFWERLYHKRIKDDSLTKEEFCWYESRKFNRGVIRNTLFDILCTRNLDEVEGKYGDTRYEPQGIAEIECTITNSIQAMDNPAVYEITDVKLLDGVDVEITGLASFTHTYAGEVMEGERAVARGKVEKVITEGKKPWYRILVGSTRESIGEYIKLKDSPVDG
ncbi:MAG: DNA polymerase subunit beta [Methanobrevibacter boviskoreani]|jgi:predicted nucleotidyltransferase|uniref:DNA polymerase subunit beta n=2 Tax=Methanobrevibacter boviskoreani TaxID=1348249 RepID=UPI0005949CCD|nr:DNA polymerase subunit beta [Methanobrevibacter boviskoreani]MDD6256835.1 DNA polymerase subunit beta [Methanobrevibacter boviskoreani]